MRLHSRKILMIHGGFLAALGGAASVISLIGLRLSEGPFGFLGSNEVAAVGFIEAYGLACLAGISLLLAGAKSYHELWHLVAAAIHLVLFTVNIAFWPLYEPLNLQPVGWISTVMHACLAGLEVLLFFNPYNKPTVAG